MATISSIYSLDMSNLDLNRLYQNYIDSGALDNEYGVYNNKTYQDVFWVDWRFNYVNYRSLFGGSNFTYNANGDITGGAVSGYLEMYWDGSDYIPYFAIENATLPAIDTWNSALSETINDDQKLLQTILSGSDSIYGSYDRDTLVGYDGNDTFYATTGNDTIIGGEGIDTLFLDEITSSQITVSKTLQGYTLTSSLGEDQLIGIEKLQLQDGVYAIDEFTSDSDKIYVLILDNFGYSSASNQNVVFLDYDFNFVDGWEDYYLDSLEPDELDQLPYSNGFGAYRVYDDNDYAYYDSYYNLDNALVKNQDFLAGDYIDNDATWDYFFYQWDNQLDKEVSYFVNDLDGLDTIPWIQEGLEQNQYLLPWSSFNDLDGAVDFYNEDGSDTYNKVDLDPNNDYRFINWESASQPDFENGKMVVLSKDEIDNLHNSGAGDFSNERFHGDIVLDNFYSELDQSLADQVVVIAVDVFDDHYQTQDEVWIYEEIGNGNIDLDLELQQAAGISLSDISVINLSIGSTAPEAEMLEQISDLGPSILWALPNGNKYGNRFWDAYLEDDIAKTTETLMVSGFDGLLPVGAIEYADVYFDIFDSELTGDYGTSYATPKAAAELVNYEANLRQSGYSLTDFSTQELIDYLNETSIKNHYDIHYDGLIISGSAENDSLRGTRNGDLFLAFEGDDHLSGGTGNDYFLAGLGIDSYDGGEGTDTLITDLYQKYEAKSWDITFNTQTGFYQSEVITSIENYTLIGEFNLTATGGEESNTFIADSGDDQLYGNAGDDNLSGGLGNNIISGGQGWDIAHFNEIKANYSVTEIGLGKFTVTHNATGDQSSLTSIEELSFLDGIISNMNITEAYSWHSHQIINNVRCDTDNVVSIEISDNETNRVVSAADALAALKIAVGLNPNSNGFETSPYQYIAADVNQDGRVSAADALSILKMAVNLSGAPEREWIVVNENTDFYDEAEQKYSINRSDIDWTTIRNDLETREVSDALTAVLKGDVNASWQGNNDSELLTEDYFVNLEANDIGITEQWWV